MQECWLLCVASDTDGQLGRLCEFSLHVKSRLVLVNILATCHAMFVQVISFRVTCGAKNAIQVFKFKSFTTVFISIPFLPRPQIVTSHDML
jgi:hypothetical protein